MNLSDKHVKALLQVGDTESDIEAVPAEVITELIGLGLLCKLADGQINFTDLGGAVYDELAGPPS